MIRDSPLTPPGAKADIEHDRVKGAFVHQTLGVKRAGGRLGLPALELEVLTEVAENGGAVVDKKNAGHKENSISVTGEF